MTHLCHVHVTAGRGQQWQYRVYYFLLVQNKQKSGLLFLSSRFALSPVRCGRVHAGRIDANVRALGTLIDKREKRDEKNVFVLNFCAELRERV